MLRAELNALSINDGLDELEDAAGTAVISVGKEKPAEADTAVPSVVVLLLDDPPPPHAVKPTTTANGTMHAQGICLRFFCSYILLVSCIFSHAGRHGRAN